MRKYKHLLDDRYDKEQILVRLVHHESKIHEIERNCKHCAWNLTNNHLNK